MRKLIYDQMREDDPIEGDEPFEECEEEGTRRGSMVDRLLLLAGGDSCAACAKESWAQMNGRLR